MGQVVYISEDLVKVRHEGSEKATVLAWGDPVEVLKSGNKQTRVRVLNRGSRPFTGTVRGKLPTRDKGVLKLAIVDVQQGDGMVLETPEGKILFLDGGDNKLFARYAANRFRGTTAKKPLGVDAMVVTHGDADHFDGLNQIARSEKHKTPRKRLFIHPKRVYHNGLVKGPSRVKGKKVKDEKMFGRTRRFGKNNEELAIVDLEDNLLEVNEKRMNAPFKRWVRSLRRWSQRGRITVRRLAHGEKHAFDFLHKEKIQVQVLGPITQRVREGGSRVEALPFLHTPRKTVQLPGPATHAQHSASHTINGHSIVLRLQFGNVRFLFSGDLNQESMRILRKKVPGRGLEAEVVKVPHHGSADFDLGVSLANC